MSIERAHFFDLMASFASGVTVVTTAHAGTLNGLTVSSFTSLSVDPMLVLICIDKTVQSHNAISAAGTFAVNILAEDQADLSMRFASRREDKFEELDYHLGATGLPLLEGTLASVECRVVGELPGGDHTIFVGEVLEGQMGTGQPLLYFQRNYHRLDP